MSALNNALNLLMGADAATPTPSYQIERSLRFNSSDSAYLSRTPASAGNRKKWTWAGWVKKTASSASSPKTLFGVYGGSNATSFTFRFDSATGDTLRVENDFTVGAPGGRTVAVFRDYSGWMHVVLSMDTTQASIASGMKIYVNGTEQQLQSTVWTQNIDTLVNSTNTHYLGFQGQAGSYLDGYLADIHFIDGQALDPTSFTEVDATTGQLVPIEYTGSYGPLVDQSEIWSNALSGSLKTPTAGFDANPYSGRSEGVGGLTFTPTTPLVFTDKVEVYDNNNVTKSRVNSGSYVQHASNAWVTVATGGGTITTMDFLRTDNPSFDAGFYAIRVDGKLLVDQGVTVPSNGFHLPFSDNSSAVALGTDTSGNGNDWTVNNLQVGGTLWSPYLSTNTSFDNSPANAFNGIIGGAGFSLDWGTRSSGTSTITFSGVNISVSSSLVAYVYGDNVNEVVAGDFQLNGSSVSMTIQKVAGVTDSGIRKCTFNASYPFTLTSLSYTNNDTGKSTILTGVEIDGNLLVDGTFGDSLVDTPTNYGADTGTGGEVRGNYCTLNAIDRSSSITPTNGNLTASDGPNVLVRGTIFVSSGKWYYECTATTVSGAFVLGVATNQASLSYLGVDAFGWGYTGAGGGLKYNAGGSVGYGSGISSGDVIGVAIDMDAKTLVFYKNNTSLGTAFSNLTGAVAPAFSGGSGSTCDFNFGQRPFAYTAPSGYKALCTTNLPAPLVAQPSTVMDVVTYPGITQSPRTITGLSFEPDFVWVKNRSRNAGHFLWDAVRGTDANLRADDTFNEADVVSSANGIISTNASNGFVVKNGSSSGTNVGSSGSDAYVAWAWDAGTTTASNPDGSITSSVRANANAGFSIVSYTGDGSSSATIGHGLNATPQLVIVKRRDNANVWVIAHTGIGTNNLQFDTSAAYSPSSASGGGGISLGNSTTISPVQGTSSIDNSNASGGTYIAYCFAPVDGYSSFGSYTGNASTDGPFVYTGFRPRWLMIKNTSSIGGNQNYASWLVLDTARDEFNVSNNTLWANRSVQEDLRGDGSTAVGSNCDIDVCSNGFKIKTGSVETNGSGNLIIYAAFAESPFKYSRAR